MHSLRRVQRRAIESSAILLALAGPAVSGNLFVVDDNGGPGVDFTDIPPALAVAEPGDVLLVKGGQYSAFNLNEGVTILGETGENVVVGAGTRVSYLPSGQLAVLRNFVSQRLRVSNCSGTVVLEDLQCISTTSTAPALEILMSADVRAVRTTAAVQGGFTAPPPGLRLKETSRLELMRSFAVGGGGLEASNGASGLQAIGFATRMHVVNTNITGGPGGTYTNPNCFNTAGDGGWGLEQKIDFVQASGSPNSSIISGGAAGTSPWGCTPGVAGLAVFVDNACLLRHSGVLFLGGVYGNVQLADPPDPFLSDLGGQQPIAGGMITLTVFGVPGDVVTLFLGRSPVVEPIPGVLIEKLTSEDRAIQLGTMGPNGYLAWPFVLPPSLPKGFCFFTQARIVRAGSELRTNSLPIIIR